MAAAAAVIHFVMVPSHMDEFATEGIAFAVAGWLQLLVAFYLWTQPTRAMLGFAVLTNLAFIAVVGRQPDRRAARSGRTRVSPRRSRWWT